MKTLRIITCLVTSLSLSTTYAQNKVFQYILNDSIQERIQMGSADRVGEERMNKGLVTTSLDALSGQAAGVNVSSTGADRMAMLSSVRVRGTTSLTGGNDPLVIIDVYRAPLRRFQASTLPTSRASPSSRTLPRRLSTAHAALRVSSK